MKWCIPVFALMFSVSSASAQDDYQYYFLVIGSANYEQHASKFAEPGFVPFDDLSAATNLARIMAAVFSKYRNAQGLTVISTANSMVTKRRVTLALGQLQQRILKDHATKPFILFYYCGHGISENMGWNQFLIPGNYTKTPGNKSFEDLSHDLIFLGDITDFFLHHKYPYMALIDCCRERNKDSSLPEKRLSYFFSQQNIETFKIVVAGLKYLNEYHQDFPVVFAISPGEVAPTVQLPSQTLVPALTTDDDSGPLCRRTLLVLETFKHSAAKSLPLAKFIQQITFAGTDHESAQSVSFYEDPKHETAGIPIFQKP
jgi:hypothetical protein